MKECLIIPLPVLRSATKRSSPDSILLYSRLILHSTESMKTAFLLIAFCSEAVIILKLCILIRTTTSAKIYITPKGWRSMYLDSELNQIKVLQLELSPDSTLLLSGNAFERRIYRCIAHFHELTDNSGHDALPPDFYSSEMNIMFDIFRVNDSEIKKTYNPTMIAERNMQQRVEQSWIAKSCPQSLDKLVCIDKDYGSDEIHNITHYIKNIKRVTKEHLGSNEHPNKIREIWMDKHPDIALKGLVVYDETENYFQGQVRPHPASGQWMLLWDSTKPLTFYKPWMDKNILQPIYDSECDFLIWFMPYKYTELFNATKENYPRIVIMDTRFPRTDFYEYDYSKFTRT